MQPNVFEFLSLVFVVVAMIAYLNHRFIKLPTTSAVMAGSMLLSLLVLVVAKIFGLSPLSDKVYQNIASFDFHKFLMQGLLSFLLFAGALNIHIDQLWKVKHEIAVLSTLSTIVSALLVSLVIYYAAPLLVYPLPFGYCLLFGSLISPTDPIAVLALFKNLEADKRLSTLVAGESLFNDGVGIVLFITFYQFTVLNLAPSVGNMVWLFLTQFFGGIFFGVALGFLGNYLLKRLNNIKVELLITLGLVTGGYTLAQHVSISGPLAMVACGIVIGRKQSKAKENLYYFWEMIDEILNAILFSLVGMELIVISHSQWSYSLSLITIIAVLFIRLLTVGIPLTIFKQFKKYPKNTIKILTWGGLRGGLAVALALSLPDCNEKSLILTLTYSVVIFSILFQGLTISHLLPAKKK